MAAEPRVINDLSGHLIAESVRYFLAAIKSPIKPKVSLKTFYFLLGLNLILEIKYLVFEALHRQSYREADKTSSKWIQSILVIILTCKKTE